MTIRTEPFLNGKWGWDFGESNWNDGMDENILKFSFMLNGNIDAIVSVLPSTPLEGSSYFLTTDNTLNVYVGAAWRTFPTPVGFIIRDKVSGLKYEFNGMAMVATLGIADKVKLDSIATGATVNSSDAALRDRSTHTGNQPISTVTGLQTSLDSKATVASPTFTGTVTLPSNTSIGGVSSTELSYLDGVTSSIQTQFGSKEPTITGGISSQYWRGDKSFQTLDKIAVGLNNVDNTSDANKPISTATTTALNLKAPLLSPVFTGTPTAPTVSVGDNSTSLATTAWVKSQGYGSGGGGGSVTSVNGYTGTVVLSKADVGLGSVDNTTDLAKPVSTATTSALNLKANLASPTFTGTVTLPTTNISASATINAPSGQASLVLSQAGTSNGRIYAGGGAGTDIVIESGRFISLSPTSSFNVNYGGLTKFSVDSTGLTTATNGSGIANLSAANIATGTLAAARLPFNYTSTNTNNAVVQRDSAGSFSANTISASSFVGDGSSLNSLNASAISIGTISDARLPSSQTGKIFTGQIFPNFNTGATPIYNTAQVQIGNAGSTNPVALGFHALGVSAASLVHISGGNGLELHSTAFGSYANFKASAITATSGFSGDGSSLTSLNASNISSGTIPDARLSANVALVPNVVTKSTPTQTFQNLGTVSGSVTVNAANGIHVLATVNANTTWTLPSPSATEAIALTLELTNGGSYTMTWPTGTRWAGGIAPTLTASGTDVIVFTKAGTNNWRGYLSAKDSK